MRPVTKTALTVAVLATALAGCSNEPPTILDPHGDPVTATPYDVPTPTYTTEPGADPYVSDDDITSSPTPVEVIETHPDPAAHGLTAGDEEAASATAMEFLQAVWAWDSTDTSDRAGLQRALPLVTADLAAQLQPYLDQPMFTPEEWATLAGQSDVGSLIEVIAVLPVEGESYDADTYTARLIYNTYIRDTSGAPLPRAEDARYATIVLTRGEAGTWLVAGLPYQDAEQIIETTASLP